MWNQTEEKRCERQRVYLQVLQLIRERGAISRVEIASALQMTRGAVSLLIQEMLEKGFLEDVGAAPTAEGKGRRKMLLDIHPSRWLLIAVSVDASHIIVGLTTLGLNTLEKQRIPFDMTAESRDVLETRIIEMVQQILKSNYIETERIIGMGIGLMPCVLQQLFPQEKAERIATWEQSLSKQLQISVFVGNALSSMTSYYLYQQPKQEVLALFCADGDAYYISFVSRAYPVECLYQEPVRMNNFYLSKQETVGTQLTPAALIRRTAPYYSAEQTPVLYRLTGGKLEQMTLPMLFAASYAEGEDFDPCLVPLMEEIMQQFCQIWSNILLLYGIDQLYLYRLDFTLPHWQEIQRYAKQYMGEKQAARLICGDLTEKCQYAGGIFYAIDGGIRTACN